MHVRRKVEIYKKRKEVARVGEETKEVLKEHSFN